jgi:hypothetical protein
MLHSDHWQKQSRFCEGELHTLKKTITFISAVLLFAMVGAATDIPRYEIYLGISMSEPTNSAKALDWQQA